MTLSELRPSEVLKYDSRRFASHSFGLRLIENKLQDALVLWTSRARNCAVRGASSGRVLILRISDRLASFSGRNLVESAWKGHEVRPSDGARPGGEGGI